MVFKELKPMPPCTTENQQDLRQIQKKQDKMAKSLTSSMNNNRLTLIPRISMVIPFNQTCSKKIIWMKINNKISLKDNRCNILKANMSSLNNPLWLSLNCYRNNRIIIKTIGLTWCNKIIIVLKLEKVIAYSIAIVTDLVMMIMIVLELGVGLRAFSQCTLEGLG